MAHAHAPDELAFERASLLDQPLDVCLLVLDPAGEQLAPCLVDSERPARLGVVPSMPRSGLEEG
jgi:hypothetical protein